MTLDQKPGDAKRNEARVMCGLLIFDGEFNGSNILVRMTDGKYHRPYGQLYDSPIHDTLQQIARDQTGLDITDLMPLGFAHFISPRREASLVFLEYAARATGVQNAVDESNSQYVWKPRATIDTAPSSLLKRALVHYDAVMKRAQPECSR
jgi:hypothetical protein